MIGSLLALAAQTQSASAELLSILQATEDRNYFFFKDLESMARTSLEVCGDLDSISYTPVTKQVLRPQIVDVVLPSGEKPSPDEMISLLAKADTTGDYLGLDQRTLPVLIQQMNRVYDTAKLESLPDEIVYSDFAQCLPAHLQSVLHASFVSPEGANCFNSALFFYDARPIEFLDELAFEEEVGLKFDPISSDSAIQYGDLGVVYDESGFPFHAFVVISENWAFTKNGKEPTKRRRFQRISSIRSRYFAKDLRYYRPKPDQASVASDQ